MMEWVSKLRRPGQQQAESDRDREAREQREARETRLAKAEEMQTLATDIREGRLPLRVIQSNDDTLDFMRRRRGNGRR